jgi:hypothetical protein
MNTIGELEINKPLRKGSARVAEVIKITKTICLDIFYFQNYIQL